MQPVAVNTSEYNKSRKTQGHGDLKPYQQFGNIKATNSLRVKRNVELKSGDAPRRFSIEMNSNKTNKPKLQEEESKNSVVEITSSISTHRNAENDMMLQDLHQMPFDVNSTRTLQLRPQKPVRLSSVSNLIYSIDV